MINSHTLSKLFNLNASFIRSIAYQSKGSWKNNHSQDKSSSFVSTANRDDRLIAVTGCNAIQAVIANGKRKVSKLYYQEDFTDSRQRIVLNRCKKLSIPLVEVGKRNTLIGLSNR